jgi:acyl carrier protein
MDRISIQSQIQDVFRDVLDNQNIMVNEETTANEVEGWDSLTHIQLIVAIEKCFTIKFSSKEIVQTKNIGELIDIVYEKLV